MYVEPPVTGVKNVSWVIELQIQQHFYKGSEERNGSHAMVLLPEGFSPEKKKPHEQLSNFVIFYSIRTTRKYITTVMKNVHA